MRAWGHVTARSTTNGAINETRRYDGRGRLWETRGNPYYVVWEQLYAPDGAVTTLEDAANGNWTYTYDALNRLLAAQCSANCPGGQASLALDWTYDRLGNRWSQAPTAGVASTASASFTGKDNRMDTDSYDAAGNLLSGGSHTYTYDAENRIIGVGGNATASYAYDAEGRRVSTTTAGGTTLRFFDQQGRTVRRIAAAGQWLSSEIYALGQPLATYDQSGANGMTWFMDVDPVGTIRTITNGSGQFAQACTSLPFGDDQTCSPAISDPSPLHFTGKSRDAETGLDDFGFRYNSSTLGRWMTPDEISGDGRDLRNPQDLNLYSYVWNNPVSLTDPTGQMVTVCVDNGYTCITMSDEEYAALYRQQNGQQGISMPGGNFPSGSITCGDQICGTVRYYEQGMEDQTAVLLSIEDLAGDAFAATAALTEGAAGAIGRFFGEATEQRTLVIGKMKDIGPETLAKGEYTLPGEGRLPNQGSPKANWLQNSTELRKEMSTRQPIRDASARPEEADGVPGQDTGFLSIERNLLRNHGWQYSDGYWYPPQ